MRIKIEQASTVVVKDEILGDDVHYAGDIVDVEESLGEALVAGGSALSMIEYRPEALDE